MILTQFFIFTLLLCFLCGISYIIFKRKSQADILTGLIWVFIGLLQLQFFLIHSKKLLDYPYFFMTYVPTIMFIGPLVYFYFETKSVDKFTLSISRLKHILPPVITLLLFTPFFLLPTTSKVTIIQDLYLGKNLIYYFPFSLLAGISAISYIIYIVKKQPKFSKFKDALSKNFFYVFALVNIVFTVSVILSLFNPFLSIIIIKIGHIIVSVLTLCAFFILFHFQNAIDSFFFEIKKERYQKSRLENINIDDIKNRLEKLMIEKKHFQKSNLTLKKLATSVGVNSHQLSEYLNTHENKNFNTYIMQFRIEEAKKLLIDFPWKTTMAIGSEVGFSSFSSFNMVFKKETGLSPGQFRKQ